MHKLIDCHIMIGLNVKLNKFKVGFELTVFDQTHFDPFFLPISYNLQKERKEKYWEVFSKKNVFGKSVRIGSLTDKFSFVWRKVQNLETRQVYQV